MKLLCNIYLLKEEVEMGYNQKLHEKTQETLLRVEIIKTSAKGMRHKRKERVNYKLYLSHVFESY